MNPPSLIDHFLHLQCNTFDTDTYASIVMESYGQDS